MRVLAAASAHTGRRVTDGGEALDEMPLSSSSSLMNVFIKLPEKLWRACATACCEPLRSIHHRVYLAPELPAAPASKQPAAYFCLLLPPSEQKGIARSDAAQAHHFDASSAGGNQSRASLQNCFAAGWTTIYSRV